MGAALMGTALMGKLRLGAVGKYRFWQGGCRFSPDYTIADLQASTINKEIRAIKIGKYDSAVPISELKAKLVELEDVLLEKELGL